MRSIVWALGAAGDTNAVIPFIYSLTNDYRGRRLTSGWPEASNEEQTLFDTVKVLGVLSRQSDIAYDFVTNGTDPWFWKRTVTWNSTNGRDTVGVLTDSSIQAVGLSGRDDSFKFIEDLKAKDMINRTGDRIEGARNFNGAVVDAAFYNSYIRREGYEKFRARFFAAGFMEEFENWTRTDEGKTWQVWYKEAEKQSRIMIGNR